MIQALGRQAPQRVAIATIEHDDLSGASRRAGRAAYGAQAIQFRGDPAEVTAEQVVAIMWAGLAAGQQVDAVIEAAWRRQSAGLDPDHSPER